VAALRNKLLDTAAIEAHLAKIVLVFPSFLQSTLVIISDHIQINSIIERVPREFPEPAELAGSVEPQSRLPLIRLRVDYTSSTVVNVQRFGAQFVGKVANPNELLLFHKKRVVHRKGSNVCTNFLSQSTSQFIESCCQKTKLSHQTIAKLSMICTLTNR
jgi:hypothetical protein